MTTPPLLRPVSTEYYDELERVYTPSAGETPRFTRPVFPYSGGVKR